MIKVKESKNLFDQYNVVYQSKGIDYLVSKLPINGLVKEYHPINNLAKIDLSYYELYETQSKIVYKVTINNSKLTEDQIAYLIGGNCAYGYTYNQREHIFTKYFD